MPFCDKAFRDVSNRKRREYRPCVPVGWSDTTWKMTVPLFPADTLNLDAVFERQCSLSRSSTQA